MDNASQEEDVLKTIMPLLAPVIRASAGLSSNDINFYTSTEPDIARHSDESSGALLKLINDVVSSVESNEVGEVQDKTMKENWSLMSNLIDEFLERSDIAFDSLRKSTGSDGASQKQMKYLDDSTSIQSQSGTQRRQDKPQRKFSKPVDNSESHPFRPSLTSKPNAIVPFERTFDLVPEEEGIPEHYKQPYETEILNQDYRSEILEICEPQLYKDWDATDAIWVDTPETLKQMLEKLENATEIAVDLEHHDYRSYYGIVCLMQISTREQDWLIDTLALRDELQVLNSVFTNPMITKVFHGAFMDIIWLQRDLGLYVVSLFDTYHASRQLGFPKHSLAYLLERFAHFKTSKKYQLADWRIRPLTKPMRAYARSDTHFLLYIYDQLKNMLIQSNKLETVLFESRNVAVRRYEYSRYRPKNSGPNSNVVSLIEKPDPWKSLLYQYNLPMSRDGIVRALYEWRDSMARQEDESPRYIMPNQLLVSLASLAPTDPAGVLSASTMISEVVRKNCKAIAELIAGKLQDTKMEDIKLLNEATSHALDEGEIQVTEESVLKEEQLFKALQTSSAIPLQLRKSSQLLSSKMISQKPFVKFRSSETIPQSINDRKKMVQSLLSKFTQTPELVDSEHGDKDMEVEDISQPAVPPEPLEQEESTSQPSIMFKNTEDIIVLNEKKKPISKVVKRIQQRGEAFDYSKADKIIKEPSRKDRKDKKRSSNQFDPYTKESEGPRPAKKQSKPHQGKTATFSSKKNRR